MINYVLRIGGNRGDVHLSSKCVIQLTDTIIYDFETYKITKAIHKIKESTTILIVVKINK